MSFDPLAYKKVRLERVDGYLYLTPPWGGMKLISGFNCAGVPERVPLKLIITEIDKRMIRGSDLIKGFLYVPLLHDRICPGLVLYHRGLDSFWLDGMRAAAVEPGGFFRVRGHVEEDKSWG